MKKHIFRKRRKKLRFMRLFCAVIPALAAFLLYLLLPLFPGLTETLFSGVIFRIIGVPLGFVFSLLPFSLTEVLAVLALPVVIFILIFFIRRMLGSKNRFRTAANAGLKVIRVVSAVMLIYMLLHGVNFYRRPASELMGLDTRKSRRSFCKVCALTLQKASPNGKT